MKQRFGIAADVYAGAATALDGTNPLPPPEDIHGRDGLGNIQMPPIHARSAGLSAAEYIVEELLRQPGEITLITVGRLTNLAMALELNPAIARCVKEVIVMGGATGRNGHTGNVSPVAEANIFGDPLAADRVFCAPLPLTMVGLDVTHEIIMDEAYFQRLRDECAEVGQFVYQISRVYTAFYREWRNLDGCFVHDASAAIYAVAPELFQTERGHLRVATEGVATGQTIFSPNNQEWFVDHWSTVPSKQICVGVDAASLLALYFRTLKGSD